MILRFVVDLAVPFTNNQAERDLRPVKIQQRTSGGTWRTLAGLADFAVVQSYLSTARKWGIDSPPVFIERLRKDHSRPGCAAPEGVRCTATVGDARAGPTPSAGWPCAFPGPVTTSAGLGVGMAAVWNGHPRVTVASTSTSPWTSVAQSAHESG